MTVGNFREIAPSLSAFGPDPGEVHAAARLGMGPRIKSEDRGERLFFSSPAKAGVQSRVRGAG